MVLNFKYLLSYYYNYCYFERNQSFVDVWDLQSLIMLYLTRHWIGYIWNADVEYWIPFLCHLKCHFVFLHGKTCISIPLISVFVLHHFIIICLSLQVCSWGGYTFIINLIPIHALLCIVTGRYSPRLYIAYAPLVSVEWFHLESFFPIKFLDWKRSNKTLTMQNHNTLVLEFYFSARFISSSLNYGFHNLGCLGNIIGCTRACCWI